MARLSRYALHRLAAFLTVSSLLFLLSCTPESPQSTFGPAGPVSRSQAQLFYIVFWVAAVIFVLVEGLLVISIVRFRHRPDHETPAQVHGNTRLEILWTIIPGAILAVVAIPTIQGIIYTASAPTGPDTVNVRVIGHQWWWEFQYSDLNITTANELHVPVGRPVSFQLEAADVIHSFWVPKLGGKRDVIPTRVNYLWWQADEAGVYSGQCAEFCGEAHAQMRLKVIADDKSAFDAWVKQQQTPPAPPSGDAQAGAKIFEQFGCVACHTIEGTTGKGTFAPNLTHVGSRTSLAAGIINNTPQELTAWLRDPQAIKPGTRMPRLGLTNDQIQALVAYLTGLK